MVAVAFQNDFRAEIYQNDVFLFFKKLFLRSAHQNDLNYKKKLNFYITWFAPCPNWIRTILPLISITILAHVRSWNGFFFFFWL